MSLEEIRTETQIKLKKYGCTTLHWQMGGDDLLCITGVVGGHEPLNPADQWPQVVFTHTASVVIFGRGVCEIVG